MRKNVSDQLVETLVAGGIKRIYSVMEDSLNHVNEAIQRNGNINWIHVRNEETAAFAAGAEVQLTGLACYAGSNGRDTCILSMDCTMRIGRRLRCWRLHLPFRPKNLEWIIFRKQTYSNCLTIAVVTTKWLQHPVRSDMKPYKNEVPLAGPLLPPFKY